MNTPILHTERLILRPPVAAVFDGWAAFHADPETMRFLGGVQPRAAAWRSFCTMVGAWQVRGYAMFSMVDRATGQWIGRTGPWMPEQWPGTEVAWGVAREFAGRGYAFEAATAAIDYAFEVLGWDEVIHTISPDNRASIRLAERLGATNRGATRLPPPYEHVPVDNWGQDVGQWRAARAARG